MSDNRKTYWEKLAREVSGNASAEDLDWIKKQQNQDPELDGARRQAERIWKGTALPEGTYEPNMEHGWQRFQLKVLARKTVNQPVAKVRKLNFQTMMGIAASVVLFIAVGLYMISRQMQPDWIEISTAASETKVIRLADGSSVSLNQNSIFSYPENFKIENRTVRLKGEAFFEVARAEGKRFTIFAQGTKTEVIGTSFNLRAYEEEPVKVQVVTGKVAFARTETDNAIFLLPGQEGIIVNREEEGEELITEPTKQKIENVNFQSWKTKDFTFTNQRLELIVSTLEQNFNTTISITNDALRNCRFTTSFKNPELKEVLDILAITGNLTITQDADGYKISGKGCK